LLRFELPIYRLAETLSEKAERLAPGDVAADNPKRRNEMMLQEGLVYGNMLVSTLEAEACHHECPRHHR